MERCPSGGRTGDHHVSDGCDAVQGGDGQGRSAAPAAPALRKVVCGHRLSPIDLLGYIIIFESLNTTPHWAHRTRADGHRTPVEVLGWLRGRRVEPQRLRELFGRTEWLRTVNRYGFVSVQRFYLYAESGLARQRVSIWIYEGQLRIEYQQTLLARYQCAYD